MDSLKKKGDWLKSFRAPGIFLLSLHRRNNDVKTMTMKRVLLATLALAAALSIRAASYTYLTFETTDGTKVSVSVSALTISVSGTTLTAGDKQFTITNLSKMYFSNADETTGISEELSVKNEESVIAIYDLKGRKVSKAEMRSGQVYIVKTESGTHKIAVK